MRGLRAGESAPPPFSREGGRGGGGVFGALGRAGTGEVHIAPRCLPGQQVADEKTCIQFSIRRPKLPSSETHPEEGVYKRLDVAAWLHHLNELGQVEEEYKLRKAIFFGGIDVSIRGEVWPFLLRYYSHESTSQEREALRAQKRKEYAEIQQKR
uniref:TBC1 domain family member 16-like n=1 Tax=Panthera onca TaxID=9690 RepID=UPI002955256D|nr:TBC1 domain family member 16-like [Panthera onca]